jgi:hypothetical protein
MRLKNTSEVANAVLDMLYGYVIYCIKSKIIILETLISIWNG